VLIIRQKKIKAEKNFEMELISHPERSMYSLQQQTFNVAVRTSKRNVTRRNKIALGPGDKTEKLRNGTDKSRRKDQRRQ
jgi:hypothetical protein